VELVGEAFFAYDLEGYSEFDVVEAFVAFVAVPYHWVIVAFDEDAFAVEV
jgi:hypothetical protein